MHDKGGVSKYSGLCMLIRGCQLDNTEMDLIILEKGLNFANLTSQLAEISNMGLLV